MKQNLKNGIAAQGYDVVSFFNSSPAKGIQSHSVKHNGANYLFSNLKNMEQFSENPDKYSPQYGGFCAIAMSEGKQVNPNPKSWEVRDGKLYFFTRMLWGIIDAKRQWVKDPETKRNLADIEWSKMNT